MGIINHIKLLERIHASILHKSTGTPKQFAKRLKISERTLYRIFVELKDQGAIIIFDPVRSTYVYENEVDIKLLLKTIDPDISK